jgi:lysophospholipid acyltransferase (LPLAT)-like uncharacterized protein
MTDILLRIRMETLPFKKRVISLLLPTLGAWVLRGLARGSAVTEAGETGLSPLAAPREPKIYAIWHEVSLAAGHYGGQPIHPLASRSFDGELISRALARLGYLAPARGSSSRAGISAGRELWRYLKRGEHVLVTVDGPKGPRRRAKDGVVRLAQQSGLAVVPVAFACRPHWRVSSWDRMLLPLPGSRGVFWFGRELRFAPDEAEGLQRLQDGLDEATRLAELYLEFNAGRVGRREAPSARPG